MRVVAIEYRAVRWRCDATGAARERSRRDAIVVSVRTARGAIGLGEAAPLPGMSRDTLAQVARAIAALAARAPLDVSDAPQIIAHFAAATSDSPAARFAIETALLDARARELDVALRTLLAPGRGCVQLPVAAVVDDSEQARAAIERGVRCLKIKLRGDGELERVRAITARVAVSGIVFRLDANRSWPRDAVRERLAALRDLAIDYVEEPCTDAHLLDHDLPFRIALDESLATLAPDELDAALRSPTLAALVLKPTLLGGLHACLELAARARAAGVRAIVSHALEGPIGTAACAELALALGGDAAVGLAAHPALLAWNQRVPQLATGAVTPATAAGLGFESVDLASLVPGLSRTHRRSIPRGCAPPRRASRRGPRASRRSSSRAEVVVATRSPQTVAAIHAAFDERRPIALLHPAASPAELARQRAAVDGASLPHDASIVLFTSGSTGAARGVVLERAAVEAAAAASASHLGWRDDDRWLVALSLAHAGGAAIVVRCMLARKPIEWAGDDRASLAVALERCTLASLVPPQLAALLDDPAWRPPGRLRAVLLGGAAANRSLLDAAAARRVPFLATYGTTESFGQLATAPLDRAGDPTAPLVALAGVELVAGTRACPGVIRVRAPLLARCYLDGTPIAPELMTGDLGFVETRALYTIGRADDVIVTGGENVHPATIEAVLAATPGVRAACAFGVPDERWGQIVGAAIAVADTFDAGAVRAWHAALPAHARPRELAIVRELPVLASGKLDRRAASRLPRKPVRYR